MVDLEVGIQLTRIIIPIIIIFGVVGNCLNIIILTRRSLSFHACSRYFLVMAINNVLYSSITLTYYLLMDGYQIDPNLGSLIQCKIIIYLINFCPFISPYFIVLASIDRWCASSTSARQRKWSNVHVANWILVITIIAIALFLIPFAMSTEIRFDDGLGCNIRITSASMNIYFSIDVIAFACIAPCLMILFGSLTIYNTHRRRVIPNAQNRRSERQLARMLLLQVGIHVLLTLPLCILYLMSIIYPSFQLNSSFHLARIILILPFHLSYTIGCAIYMISGRIYRQEFIRLYHKMIKRQLPNTNNRVHATMLALSVVEHAYH